MASVFDQAMGDGDQYEEAMRAVDHLREHCPTLADLLGGTRGIHGVVDRPPGSLRMFTNGGEVKLEITGMEWTRKGYILVPKELNKFTIFESLLLTGKIGWTRKTEQKDGSKKVPY